MEKALAYIYAWKRCVRAPPLAGNLHLTSSMLLFFPHSILPSLPPIRPSFPSGALAIPIYLFLLPTEGKALPEYALCCWGLSGMLDSAFFFFSLSHSLPVSLSLPAKPHCLYLSSFPAPPLPPLARSLFLSVAARGTNRRPAELNVPIAESQMALAEGGAGSEVWMPPRRGAM